MNEVQEFILQRAMQKIASKYLEKVANRQALTEQQFVALMTPKAKKAWAATSKEGRANLLRVYNNPKPLKNGATYAPTTKVDVDASGNWSF